MKLHNLIFLLLLAMLTSAQTLAQSRMSLQGGWTVSKIRALYESGTIGPGQIDDSFTKFSFWNTWYAGVEYEYDCKKLRLSTGFSMMAMGAGDTPLFAGYPWVVGYWTFPLLGGYHLKLDKGWAITFEGGVEIGFQNGKYVGGLMTPGSPWGNINAVLVVETEWKNFRLGVRGQLGVTTFRTFYSITYKHTATTMYLGYTLWDHNKAKARRLRKQQETRLE